MRGEPRSSSFLDGGGEAGALARSIDWSRTPLGAVERWSFSFFKFNLQAMRDLDGNVYGMMAVALDVTELVRSRRVLERAQVEREKLLADLENAGRAKDEFLAMLGHELRNPLSPIVTALELMKLRGDGTTSKEQHITRGKVELRKESVQIAEVLAKAVEMASFLLEQRSHQLTIDVPPKLEWQGDPVRLAQVVANLLTNAARYTNPGGRIALDARADGAEIVIRVKDNGADRAEGGLGIGLTLVKNLVTLHGGTVVALSDGLGRGSEFVIRLPAVTPTELGRSETRPITPPLGSASSPRRVLVVDDNADAAELLAEMLRSVGHEVEVANDPLAALTLVDSFDPQAAILDIGLPVMDGYELAGRILAQPRSAPCQLIALTGYGQDHDRERSRAAGFDSHLVKPVDVNLLLSILAGTREQSWR